MKRRRISAKERLAIFTASDGVCHICGGKIDGGRERWDVEHVIPLNLGGEDGGDNLKPAHPACHAGKSKIDARNAAKAKRMRQRTSGVHRQPRQRLPGSRGSGWKAKIGGRWEKRNDL